MIRKVLANAIHDQLLDILIGLGNQIDVPGLADKVLSCLIVACNQLFREFFALFVDRQATHANQFTVNTYPTRLRGQVIDDFKALAQIYAVCHYESAVWCFSTSSRCANACV